MIMLLPNDHTSGTRPDTPTPAACVADNDLALGQIVEAVSHSKFWKDTCIFVVQDDPQNGFDHIDGHRTVALAISPYTRRGALDSTNYNQTSMVRTMELILGLAESQALRGRAEQDPARPAQSADGRHSRRSAAALGRGLTQAALGR